jgi:transcriptional regulator GlxA family with amidase domain
MKPKKDVKLEFWRRLSPAPFKGFEERDRFKTSNHKAVSRSLQFMAQNYTRPIQLGDVVVASGMSRRGFLKAFIRHVGRTPGSFMRQARIEFAKRLLIELDLPLKTIVPIIGFRSENTFCIAFNRATGMAPKQFQRQAWLSVYRTAVSRQIFNSNESLINRQLNRTNSMPQ